MAGVGCLNPAYATYTLCVIANNSVWFQTFNRFAGDGSEFGVINSIRSMTITATLPFRPPRRRAFHKYQVLIGSATAPPTMAPAWVKQLTAFATGPRIVCLRIESIGQPLGRVRRRGLLLGERYLDLFFALSAASYGGRVDGACPLERNSCRLMSMQCGPCVIVTNYR